MNKALFPGSFDPPTLGHLEIIKRASSLVEQLIVGVGENLSKKNSLLTVEEKVAILEKETSQFKNVQVLPFTGLVTTFAKENGIAFLIRGIRPGEDLSYELQMARANKKLAGIETLMMPGDEHAALSSSLIRELAHHHAPLSEFIPKDAEVILYKKKER